MDCHFFHRSLPELVQVADILVLQFVNDWELLSLCERRRAAGKITVFEANDYFFDLQPWNPIASQWLDRSLGELYGQLLRSADAVQTSTEELARHWRQRGARGRGIAKPGCRSAAIVFNRRPTAHRGLGGLPWAFCRLV